MGWHRVDIWRVLVENGKVSKITDDNGREVEPFETFPGGWRKVHGLTLSAFRGRIKRRTIIMQTSMEWLEKACGPADWGW